MNNEFQVEKIIAYRSRDKKYLIKWQGFPDSENTWEPEENLENCKSLLKKFKDKQQKDENKQIVGMKYNRGNGFVYFKTQKGIEVKTFNEAIRCSSELLVKYICDNADIREDGTNKKLKPKNNIKSNKYIQGVFKTNKTKEIIYKVVDGSNVYYLSKQEVIREYSKEFLKFIETSITFK